MNDRFAVLNDTACVSPSAVTTDIARFAPLAYEELPAVAVTLLSALARHDGHTYLHSLRVGRFTSQLAGELGYDWRQSKLLFLAGLLHDIGKINTPHSLLVKPHALSAHEWKIMQLHAHDGGQLLQHDLAWLTPIIDAHHERPDGLGYPRGLRAGAIAHESLIVAVSDAIDAMMSWRPYAPPLPAHEVVAKLLAGAGTHWDAQVATTAAQMLGSVPLRTKEVLPSRTYDSTRTRTIYAISS